MTGEEPAFDDLKRGHVVLAPDPFTSDDDATRPWVVVNNERHPFDAEQYVVMALTTRTWYDERIPLDEGAHPTRRGCVSASPCAPRQFGRPACGRVASSGTDDGLRLSGSRRADRPSRRDVGGVSLSGNCTDLRETYRSGKHEQTMLDMRIH